MKCPAARRAVFAEGENTEGEFIITYNQVLKISETHLLMGISELYGLVGYETKPIPAHNGGRNVIYTCEKDGAIPKIIRIAFLKDRDREDFLAETEYVRYLYENGGSVSNVVNSRNGNLVEEIVYDNRTFFICVFEKAKGKMLVENNYRYREGVPISEYFYDCGKVLGKLHQLSKEYVLADGSRPVHRRYSFSDKFDTGYINKLIPGSLSLLKEKLFGILEALSGLDKGNESYGMIHFDYNDGNYNIDFETGEITVYDFDNCCFGWYLLDLAGVWTSGVGWIQFEQDPVKRKAFMDNYWENVLAGYRSETDISDKALENFQLFIRVELMENIVECFKDMHNFGEMPRSNEELSYLIKCLEDDIPYRGFFHDIYSCEEPFEYEARDI